MILHQTVFTCDRCGEKELVFDGHGYYPQGWSAKTIKAKNEKVLLCPECSKEYNEQMRINEENEKLWFNKPKEEW